MTTTKAITLRKKVHKNNHQTLAKEFVKRIKWNTNEEIEKRAKLKQL